MSLLGLPNELLLMIAEQMPSNRDINAMAQANRFTYALLNKSLYSRNIRKSGSSVLIWAAKHGRRGTAQYLIRGGADIETNSRPLVQRPLHIAATYGRLEVAQLLVDHGATINCLDGQFKTPLHYAAEHGHADVANMLLRHGHELMEKTNHLMPESPLHQAAKYGHAKVVRVLVEAGSDINATKFNTRETALHLSMEHFRYPMPQKGKRKRDSVEERDVKKAKTAVLLIEHGADIHARPRSNKSPLELAVQVSYVNVVRRLLERGADPNVGVNMPWTTAPPSPPPRHTPGTMTLISLARNRGNKEIIYLLHDAQAKLLATGGKITMVLHWNCIPGGFVTVGLY